MHRNLNILMLGGAKRVAMAEQLIRNEQVAGSIPVDGSKKSK